jgi:hypothetical protein
MKSKYMVWGIPLVILVVILFLIINSKKEIFFKFQPPEQVVENGWKVYRNTKYGFEFKYPPNYITFYVPSTDLKSLIPASKESNSITLIDKANQEQVLCCEPNTLSFNILNTAQTPEELIDLLKKDGRVKAVNRITFAGQSAYEIDGYGGFASPYRTIIIMNGGNRIYITEDINNEIENQILDSFVFN